MKVKMTYYVLYMTENGIGNRVVQVDGGIQAAGQLQAICNQIMNQDKVNGVQILTWRHLPAHDGADGVYYSGNEKSYEFLGEE